MNGERQAALARKRQQREPPNIKEALCCEEEAMDVRLTSEEGGVLMEILEERDRVLREKIAHSRKAAPKKALKEAETRLETIIKKIEMERTDEEIFSDLWW